MKFHHDEAIVTKFGENYTGLIRVSGLEDRTVLMSQCNRLKTRCALPEILAASDTAASAWRTLFSRMGAKQKSVSSIEALRNFFLKRGQLFSVNPVVDFYNYYSLSAATPMGAYDLTKFEGDLRLRELEPGRTFTPLGNPDRSEPPQAGEVGYIDDGKIICRYWNWRDCDQTKVTDETLDVLFVFDILARDAASATARYGEFVEDFRKVFGDKAIACGVTGGGLNLELSV